MVMIVVSLFFVKQLNFMLDFDMGYRTKNIIKVPIRRTGMLGISSSSSKTDIDYGKLFNTMNACTIIEKWTNEGDSPNSEVYAADTKILPGGGEHKMNMLMGSKRWFDFFDFQLVDGRMWNDDGEKDVALISESGLKYLGTTDYKDAEVELTLWGIKYRIIGVVKDCHLTRLSGEQYPVLIYPSRSLGENVIASFRPERKQEVIEFMKNLHSELVGGEFAYSFLEDEIADMYRNDRRIAVISAIFTGVAIFISVLGLFGISLFDIRRRRKEIAIRKINGAMMSDIVRLLMKKYLVMLGIAFVVATPVAMFVVHKYLENFAYKTTVSWWLFTVALVVTMVVSLATLLYQIYKASNENPAEVVKS
jgi:hypothetical protein